MRRHTEAKSGLCTTVARKVSAGQGQLAQRIEEDRGGQFEGRLGGREGKGREDQCMDQSWEGAGTGSKPPSPAWSTWLAVWLPQIQVIALLGRLPNDTG